MPAAQAHARTPPARPRQIDKRTTTQATALAQSYRERLYQNPQSLAEVVSVSAVREDGELLGYRIAPGKTGSSLSSWVSRRATW